MLHFEETNKVGVLNVFPIKVFHVYSNPLTKMLTHIEHVENTFWIKAAIANESKMNIHVCPPHLNFDRYILYMVVSLAIIP